MMLHDGMFEASGFLPDTRACMQDQGRVGAMSIPAKHIPGIPPRAAKRQTHPGNCLPTGFPDQINSLLAWTGSDFGPGGQQYAWTLSENHIRELEAACRHFCGG